jgi:hypothetical protein
MLEYELMGVWYRRRCAEPDPFLLDDFDYSIYERTKMINRYACVTPAISAADGLMPRRTGIVIVTTVNQVWL